MRRTRQAPALAALLVVLLTGCGGGDESPTGRPAAGKPAPVQRDLTPNPDATRALQERLRTEAASLAGRVRAAEVNGSTATVITRLRPTSDDKRHARRLCIVAAGTEGVDAVRIVGVRRNLLFDC